MMPLLDLQRRYTFAEVQAVFPEAYFTIQVWRAEFRPCQWADYCTIRPDETQEGLNALYRLQREHTPARIVIQCGVSPCTALGMQLAENELTRALQAQNAPDGG